MRHQMEQAAAGHLLVLSLHTCVHVHERWYSHPLICTRMETSKHGSSRTQCLCSVVLYFQEKRLKNVFFAMNDSEIAITFHLTLNVLVWAYKITITVFEPRVLS